MNNIPDDFKKIASSSRLPRKYCSSESSLSDDDGHEIEHVLKHGAPEEALTPDTERMVVLGQDVVQSAPASLVPGGNLSWMSKIKS